MAPTLPASRGSLPPEGAAPPAAWQSQFRGWYLHDGGRVQLPILSTAGVLHSPWGLALLRKCVPASASTGRRTGFAGLQAGRPPWGAGSYTQ